MVLQETNARATSYINFQDKITEEVQDLEQYVDESGKLCVDGYYLYINGAGDVKWHKRPDESNGVGFIEGSEETEKMRELREKIKASQTYQEFINLNKTRENE